MRRHKEQPVHFCSAVSIAPMVTLYHANTGTFKDITGHLQTVTDTIQGFF